MFNSFTKMQSEQQSFQSAAGDGQGLSCADVSGELAPSLQSYEGKHSRWSILVRQ